MEDEERDVNVTDLDENELIKPDLAELQEQNQLIEVIQTKTTNYENLMVFQNPEFGQVQMAEINGKMYACGSDVAKALGYAKPYNAISTHCRYTLKQGIPHPQNPGKSIKMSFIPEGDVYRLIVNSKLPSAEKFERWVFDEVLPQVMRKGSYAMERKILELIQEQNTELQEQRKMIEALQTSNQTSDEMIIRFWNEFADEFVWDLLPFTFLYSLYKAWMAENKMSESTIGRNKFMDSLLSAIKTDEKWYCKEKSKNIRVLSRMSKNEPLVMRYRLKKFMKPNYQYPPYCRGITRQ